MKILLDLYKTFFKIGIFTFGGGYAMLPLLQRELVDKKGWITEDEMLDYYAIGQTTPGIIAVNTSTFCGYKKAGKLGGIIASLGFVSPSIIIIIIIANFLEKFAHLAVINHAFAGIRIAVSALVLNTVINMVKKTCDRKLKYLIFFLTFISIGVFSISPIIIVISVGVLGIILGGRYA
ncbi:chromate transporter [Anaerococcus porci]|uniref:Chromate transporter n=1 Tax=Anaerococcus porci TaxID=2652269 RepID=A0A6N7VXP2_9FIRM|nr:chromate transporter [Anaerococcus porci]MDY3006346.1 chromate transporter [Anaerococcus porci]MSS78773.1 chromate transporter [Anaerococcus porci]